MEIYLLCMSIVALGLIAYMAQIVTVHSQVSSPNPHSSGEGASSLPAFSPPISILKPLKGLDDNLFDNLASFCQLDYPVYEVIFSLQDHNDPAYRIARMVQLKYPECDISIVVQRCDTGFNPKVNNLIPAYEKAKYSYFLISDSNVMVQGNYLKDIVRHMEDPSVGLVSNIIRGVGGYSLGAVFENLHLNSFIVGSVCFLDRILKMPCVVGKSMLMRKNDFESIGGFGAVRNVLAEDYLLGKLIHGQGKRVVLSNHIIDNVNEFWSVRKFINRHTRWGKLRWKIGGIRYISELVGNPVFVALLPVLVWEANQMTVLSGMLVALLKIAGDYMLARKIQGDMKPSRYLLVPLKDIVIGMIWFVPLFSQTVSWRGNRYLIGKNSSLSAAPDGAFASIWCRLSNAILARFA